MKPFNILVVEDDSSMGFVLDECLKREQYTTMLAADGQKAVDLFKRELPDLVLLDLIIPKISGMQVLEHIKAINPNIAVIILTGNATINTAVEAMKKGAYDFLTKPFEVEELLLTVKKGLDHTRVNQENQNARNHSKELGSSLYKSRNSSNMKIMDELIESIASCDDTILIEGESGTGKSLIAKEIHNLSSRKDGPFVRIDCAALPANLIESELFGYEKGAFTGAVNRKPGKVERANGGTLFLDEISTLDINGQAALLSLIQNREFERIGGNSPQAVNTRVIAASNQNLKQMVKDKLFRHDLYYRLNVFTIDLPSLKERIEDIIPLAYFFINKYNQDDDRDIILSTEAAMKIKHYEWPGNIRELENAIKHALILLKDEELITSAHLPLELNQGYWAVRDKNLGLKQILERTEISVIQQALLENDLNVKACAKALKMSQRTLYYRIDKLGIGLPVKVE